MARRPVRDLSLTAIALALALSGCGKPFTASLDRTVDPVAAPAEEVDQPATSSETHRGQTASARAPVARVPQAEQYPAEDPPWLAELLQAPDPNVRMQALDAWARQPTASLDPVTYALIDPDESVRARAQEIFDGELARR